MSIDWTFKQLTKFQGFGADPDLAKGKSATDKALNGVKNDVNGDIIEFTKFINSVPYEIGTTEQTIAEMHFGLKQPRDVEEWTEIKFISTSSANLIIRYYLDNILVAEYSPIDDFGAAIGYDVWIENSGLCFSRITQGEPQEHTTNYHYHLTEIDANRPHKWTVTAMASAGTVNVGVGGVHSVIWAPGLIGEEGFNGYISAADDVPFLMFETMDLFGDMSDDVTITTTGAADDITTESGDVITTETGDTITTANIEDLPNADPLDGSEYIPIVQNGATVKTTTQDAAEV
jgi:hypothetical protein